MRLTQEVECTHTLNRGDQPLTLGQQQYIDRILAENGLSLRVIEGEGRVNLSGLPIDIGNQILAKIQKTLGVFVIYNRSAYEAESGAAALEEKDWLRDPHWGEHHGVDDNYARDISILTV